MAQPADGYPASTVILIALVPLFGLAGIFLEGAWRIIPVVALVMVAAALGATVRAQVEKQRGARGLN